MQLKLFSLFIIISLALGCLAAPTKSFSTSAAPDLNGSMDLCNSTDSTEIGSVKPTTTGLQTESIFKTISRFLSHKPYKREEWVSGSAGSEICMACDIMAYQMDDEPIDEINYADMADYDSYSISTVETSNNYDDVSDISDDRGDVLVTTRGSRTIPPMTIGKSQVPVNFDESVYDEETFALKLKLQHMRNHPELYPKQPVSSVNPVDISSQTSAKPTSTLTPAKDQLKIENRKHSYRGPEAAKGNNSSEGFNTLTEISSQAAGTSKIYSSYALNFSLFMAIMTHFQ